MAINGTILSNIRNIIGVSSTISDEAIIRHINDYLLNDFMNDCCQFYLREIVSFKKVGSSSLYLASNINRLNPIHIKASCDELQYPLHFYTSKRIRNVYKDINFGARGVMQSMFFTTDDSVYMESTYRVLNAIEGKVSYGAPFTYEGFTGVETDRRGILDPFWLSVAIFNLDKNLEVEIAYFNPTLQYKLYTDEKDKFKITIDYEFQTLTLLQIDDKDPTVYNVRIQSRSASGYIALIKDDRLYASTYAPADYNEILMIECYLYPRLVSDLDKLDPIIIRAKSLIEIGVARLLSLIYEVSTNYDEIDKKYMSEVKRHKNEEVAKQIFELNKRPQIGSNGVLYGGNSFISPYGIDYY